MEVQEKVNSEWLNNLIRLTQEDDRLKGLRTVVKETEKGTYVLELHQGVDLIHKATYPNQHVMNQSFPNTFLYIISKGIESFHKSR